jgi:hypothetical protein
VSANSTTLLNTVVCSRMKASLLRRSCFGSRVVESWRTRFRVVRGSTSRSMAWPDPAPPGFRETASFACGLRPLASLGFGVWRPSSAHVRVPSRCRHHPRVSSSAHNLTELPSNGQWSSPSPCYYAYSSMHSARWQSRGGCRVSSGLGSCCWLAGRFTCVLPAAPMDHRA